MQRYGVSVDILNTPELDSGFIPLLKYNRAFLKDAKKPVSVAWSGRTDRCPPIIPSSTAQMKCWRQIATISSAS